MKYGLRVTWKVPHIDGLPPIGSKIALPHTSVGRAHWTNGVITGYLDARDIRRSPEASGHEAWVMARIDEEGFENTNPSPYRLADCPLLDIARQPLGWPNIIEVSLDIEAIRVRNNIHEDEFADLLRWWLKDRGYLKKPNGD